MNASNFRRNTLISILVVQTIALLVYTLYAVNTEGWTLFQVIAENLVSLTWNGQFNLDFSCYLVLSGIWIMWRNKFSTSTIVFAIIAMIMGIIVFAPYLLYLIKVEGGDMKRVLLGVR